MYGPADREAGGAPVRSGAARGHEGYFHETAFYGSDEEFAALACRFVADGVAAGEPTLVACDDTNEALLRDALGRTAGVTFLPAADHYVRPAVTIRAYRQVFADLVAAGARQIRALGDVPHTGVPWDVWARYEAVINHAYDEFPLWSLCSYDTRTASAEVIADVERTHPRITSVDGDHRPNPWFTDPDGFLAARPAPPPDVLEARPPSVVLVDPSPAAVRRAVRASAETTTLTSEEVDDLVFAASEAVTNGLSHGVAPVRFRLWADRDRVVLTVTDQGTGPKDLKAGLLPTTDTATAGLGLWLAHQTCEYVALGRDHEGFTVRVVAGRARPAR